MSTARLEDIWRGYNDCCKRKRRSSACAVFSLSEQEKVPKLWRELIDGRYEIDYSDAFVIPRPKYREVFAADFRDRIVHHFLINRTLTLFENKFLPDVYSCRKGKGTLYAVKRIQEAMKQMDDGWILKCDIENFFMNIDKNILLKLLRDFYVENYKGDDFDFIWSITEKIVTNQPEKKCIRKGNIALWDKLAPEKSLFSSPEHKGLPIGNLPSQIYGNFYLADFDEMVTNTEGVFFEGRTTDDFVVLSKDKKVLLRLLPVMRKWLKENRDLNLHPKKVYLQHISKGVTFAGFIVRKDRIYIGKRCMANATELVRRYNEKANNERHLLSTIENFAQRYNSYMGFLIHTSSYNIRKRLWDLIDDKIKKYVYITGNFAVMRVRNKYKLKNIKLYELRNRKKTNSAYSFGKA